MKRDHEHGLPPESRRQSAQLERVESALAPFLGILAAVVLLLLGVTLVTRTTKHLRESAEQAAEFPR